MEIKELDLSNIDHTIREEIIALYRQLSPGKTYQDISQVLRADNGVYLIGGFQDGNLVGIASMAVYCVISGHKGWIEDVVVDNAYRGQGIGRKLIEYLLKYSREMNLTEVLLFTESHRIAARKLYENLGFRIKDSSIYVLKH
ncbi:GNAT family N-acetyltransferase [Sphingobacterium chuzhouense]|uniref:GNAT family N-acetyltransferase n=1 Tax=Sphingobacterium chuzhouense TaxID=1742264 RepID=A0ABR7XSZ5_9SPHI|nr:GNAT family N-acetyltransferase [Sphingobacterium chuzhouense]MBD1421639.1 GNAT family N-acetyltransferase [Sphingobacterium chuzhouense]